jgi:hypothetical protein
LGTKYLVVLCAGSTLPLAKQSLDEAPYKLSGAVPKLAGITFSRLAFSYWIDNLGFITEGKTCCYIHQTFSWGFPTGRLFYFINKRNQAFWHHHHRATIKNISLFLWSMNHTSCIDFQRAKEA